MNEKAKFTECSDDQVQRINEIRNRFSDMYTLFEQITQTSRESSLATTKLEEAQFWIIKSITREKKENG